MSETKITPLPKWQSHKVVEAAKITGVSEAELSTGRQDVIFVWHLEGGYKVDVREPLAIRVTRGQSPIGGYYVRYPDGFESWSPADAFEAGYTPYTETEHV